MYEVGSTSIMHVETNHIYSCGWETSKGETNHLGDIGEDGRIILNYILEYYVVRVELS
jgi:hypothetical protein